MYVTSYVGGLNKVLQHSSSQESCLGCRMTSSFTVVCIPHVCVICYLDIVKCVVCWYTFICVCVKEVGNIVKDVGRHFTYGYTGGGISVWH